jgi:hypothetical protein
VDNKDRILKSLYRYTRLAGYTDNSWTPYEAKDNEDLEAIHAK